jgi:hypothetical protein
MGNGSKIPYQECEPVFEIWQEKSTLSDFQGLALTLS